MNDGTTAKRTLEQWPHAVTFNLSCLSSQILRLFENKTESRNGFTRSVFLSFPLFYPSQRHGVQLGESFTGARGISISPVCLNPSKKLRAVVSEVTRTRSKVQRLQKWAKTESLAKERARTRESRERERKNPRPMNLHPFPRSQQLSASKIVSDCAQIF